MKRLDRTVENLQQFVLAELATDGAIDGILTICNRLLETTNLKRHTFHTTGSQRLLVKGRFTQRQFESLLKKYISK